MAVALLSQHSPVEQPPGHALGDVFAITRQRVVGRKLPRGSMSGAAQSHVSSPPRRQQGPVGSSPIILHLLPSLTPGSAETGGGLLDVCKQLTEIKIT